MRRLFWLAMGVTIGVLVVRKLSSAAEKLTPQSIAGQLVDGLRDLADAIGDFGADVRAPRPSASGSCGPVPVWTPRSLSPATSAAARTPPSKAPTGPSPSETTS